MKKRAYHFTVPLLVSFTNYDDLLESNKKQLRADAHKMCVNALRSVNK